MQAKSVWGNQVIRREISPVRERPARDGCRAGARCPGKANYADFTSVMTQRHERGHRRDLKQPLQVQHICNLALVACFVDKVFAWPGHLAPPGHPSRADLSRTGEISLLTTLFSALFIRPTLSYLCFLGFPVTFYYPMCRTLHY